MAQSEGRECRGEARAGERLAPIFAVGFHSRRCLNVLVH